MGEAAQPHPILVLPHQQRHILRHAAQYLTLAPIISARPEIGEAGANYATHTSVAFSTCRLQDVGGRAAQEHAADRKVRRSSTCSTELMTEKEHGCLFPDEN